MATSRRDSFEIFPQSDEVDNEPDYMGFNGYNDLPPTECKYKPTPKLRNRSNMKKNSRKSLKPDDIQRCVANIAHVMSDEAVEDLTSLDRCIDDLLNLHEFGEESRNKIGELLNRYGITEKLVWLLETAFSMTDEEPDAQTTFVDTLKVSLKFTDSSPAFAERLASYGVVEFLTKSLNFASLSSENASPETLTSYICILLNIAIQFEENTALFAKARTPQALKKFVSHEVDDIKLASVVALCHICSDQEILHFKLHGEDVARISTEWLKEVISKKRTRRDNSLQPWKIISALTKLVAIDQMSEKLKKTELIDCVSHILSESVNTSELTACREFLQASNSEADENRSTCLKRKEKSEEVSQNPYTPMSSTAVMPKIRTTRKEKDVPYFEQVREVDLLLIGKTGNGKSAVGNTIIGRKAFKSCSSSSSVTRDVTFDVVKFEDCIIKVVDGPGVADTDGIKDVQTATQIMVDKMQDAVTLSLAGYHAFLLVVKYGNRFTIEDHACIKILKNIFGEEFVKNYCILLMTCGDNYKDEHETLPFKEWCQEQSGDFHKLLKECNNKVVLFDNRSKDENVRHQQIKELLRVLDSMQFAGKRYTDAKFQEVAAGREKLLLESKEPMISEDTLLKVNLIIQELHELHKAEEESQKIKLVSLNERAETLLRQIVDLDKGTGVLKHSIEATENLVKTISDRVHHLDKFLAERQEFYQKQNEIEARYKTEIDLQGIKLEKLKSQKKKLEENFLERDNSIREQNENWGREIAEREKNERQLLQNKRNELNENFNSQIHCIQIQLKDPNIDAKTRREMEQERDNVKKYFEKELLQLEAQEKELAQTIEAERKKARDEMKREKKSWKSELHQAQSMIDKNVADMKEREQKLKKDFEAEKEEMGNLFMEATKHIVGLNDMKHNKDKALMLALYEKMKQSYENEAKKRTKKDKSSCVIS